VKLAFLLLLRFVVRIVRLRSVRPPTSASMRISPGILRGSMSVGVRGMHPLFQKANSRSNLSPPNVSGQRHSRRIFCHRHDHRTHAPNLRGIDRGVLQASPLSRAMLGPSVNSIIRNTDSEIRVIGSHIIIMRAISLVKVTTTGLALTY